VDKIAEIVNHSDSGIGVFPEPSPSESSPEVNGDISLSLDDSCQPEFFRELGTHHSNLYYQFCGAIHSQTGAI
jgi:hypothetical protein